VPYLHVLDMYHDLSISKLINNHQIQYFPKAC